MAERYRKHFLEMAMPAPEAVDLPPVQLKGFNGIRSATFVGWSRLGTCGAALPHTLSPAVHLFYFPVGFSKEWRLL